MSSRGRGVRRGRGGRRPRRRRDRVAEEMRRGMNPRYGRLHFARVSLQNTEGRIRGNEQALQTVDRLRSEGVSELQNEIRQLREEQRSSNTRALQRIVVPQQSTLTQLPHINISSLELTAKETSGQKGRLERAQVQQLRDSERSIAQVAHLREQIKSDLRYLGFIKGDQFRIARRERSTRTHSEHEAGGRHAYASTSRSPEPSPQTVPLERRPPPELGSDEDDFMQAR